MTRRGDRTRRSLVVAVVVALLGVLTVVSGTFPAAPSAYAIPGQGVPFDCSGGTIYNVQRGSGSNGILNAVSVGSMSGTNPVSTAQVSTTIPDNQPNALGITAGGTAAWALAPQAPGGTGNTLTFQLRNYNPTTQAWTNFTATVDTTGKLPSGVTAASIRSGGIVAGAVDRLSGNYYWASLATAPNNSVIIFGWNTTTNTSIGVVANSTWPEAVPSTGSANGDITFDRNGNVLIVSSVGTNAALGIIQGPLPTTPQTNPPTLQDTRLTAYANTNSNAYNGIAFDNTGSLYLEFSSSGGTTTSILKIDPNTGAVLAGPSQVNFSGTGGTIGVDLAACSTPPVMQLQKNVISRQNVTDQFNLSMTGGGLSGGNTATTSGTATGIQAAKAGPVLGVTGTTYTFAETGVGTTVMANYTTTYQCVDQGQVGSPVIQSGTAQSFNLTLPAPVVGETGQSIVCTFSNQAPTLTLVKSVVNTVGNAPATPNMWLLAATPTAGGAISFGPGSASGVTKVVSPSTFTLAETRNTSPAPPNGYTDGTVWTCVNAANNPVTVTNGNQVAVGPPDHITCTISNTAADLARLTLRKVVVGGTATAGQFTLTAQQGQNNPGSIDGNPISGVTGATAVTNRPVTRGQFALGETGPVGYVSAWRCVNGAGTTISTTSQVEVPTTFTNVNQLAITCTVTNTTSALDVNVTGSSTNPVGRSHTFTLTATRVDTGAPLSGALLNLTFSNPADVTSNTCQTAPGTNAQGQCTVTVNSNAAGQFVLTVNGFTNQGPNAPQPGQPFTLPAPVSTSKLWTTYRVTGESAVNLVGETQHVFTLHGFQNDGTGDSALPAGSVIAYTWSGGGPVSPPAQCTVNASGTCDVTVAAAANQPETSTLTVKSITVRLPDGSGGNTTTTLSAGDVALSASLPVLTKTWIGFRVLVSPSAQVNLVGQPHTFTVTAQYAVTPGAWQPVSGGTIAFTWTSNVAQPDPSSTCPVLSTAGTCTFTVVQPTPPEAGIGTFAVTGLTAPHVTIGGQPATITDELGSSSLDLTGATAQKTWVLIDVTITPGVDNLAGEPHDFIVTVTGFDGQGPFVDGTGVPGAVVTSSVLSAVGGAAISGGTCATGTDATGKCTITVTNPGSGSIVVQLGQVSFTLDGQPFVVTLTAGSPGLRFDQVLPVQTDKVWWQYRVRLSDSAINPLGVNHTFTATVERTKDGGTTWLPVPDGALLQDSWSDPFNVSSVVTANSTCLTTGTAPDGTCTFEVTSTGPTTATLVIQGIGSTFLDRNRNGQNDPPTETVSVPASMFGTGSVLSASKTWLDFTVDVSGPSENPVGTDHTFTLTVQFSDGFGFQPVGPGTTMTYSWSGPSGSAEDTGRSTCDPANGPGTNPSGQCTVVIASPTVPGTGTLTITGIASTSIPQPTRNVSFTFPTPGTTTKTWIAYRALTSPDSTNLAGTSHDFTVTVQQDRGDGAGFVSVPDGTTIAVDLSDPSKLVSENCSTTGTTAGTCTVTVTSSVPGVVTVTPGAITVMLLSGADPPGTTAPVTVTPGSAAYATPASAIKTWIAYRVTVSPSATNLVGAPHGFTITATVTDGTTTSPAAGASIAFTWTGAGALVTPSPCVTTAAGTCTVTVNSTSAGSGTLTVTSLTDTGGRVVDLTTANAPGQVTGQVVPLTTTKTWLAYSVTITPSATNPAGTHHDFVISATVTDGTTTSPAAGASIAFTWTGAGALVTPSPCVTTLSGSCTVTVSSPSAGSGTLTVMSLTDSSNRVVDLTIAGAPGQSPGQTVPLVASKTWLQYRVLLTANATNLTGVPHTFTATVQQTGVASPTDADWTPVPDGTTLTASTSGPGALDPTSTCLTPGTAPDGTCQFTVSDAGAGTLTLTVSAINTTTVDGAPFTNIALTTPVTATKTWVSVSVSVTPPSATNLAGDPHTFTVHVDVAGADGTATSQPADGATVTWTFTGPATETADSCATGTTAGTCVVTFANSGAGAGTFTATSVTVTVNGTPLTVDLTTAGANGQAPGQVVPVTAAKTWVAYTVTISPSATNPVGTQHDFVLTATVTDGTTTSPAAGASIAFTWTGAGAPDRPSPCVTTASGSCTVTVSSTAAGTGTLTVTSLTDSGGATVDLTAVGMPGQAPGQVVPLAATKTWLQYRVVLSPNATNLTGVPHTFTATVQQTGVADPTEADWTAVPDGTTLTASASGSGTLDPASTCLTPGTASGGCQFVVHDTGAGGLTLTVTAINATTVDGRPFADIALTTPVTATKTWLAYTVTITPSATNPVGTQHDFVLTATVNDGTSTTPAAGASIAFTWTGAGAPDPPSPCVTTASGSCTVTVSSPAAGSGTLTVTSLTDSSSRVVDLTTAGSPGQAPDQTVPLSASKTWLQYRVLLSPSATNLTGVPHTFTATVQQTGVANPAESDWTSVPDGTTLTATPSGAGTLDPASTCLAGGTSAGTCGFTVHDAGPGTLTLTVTAIDATTVGGVPFSNITLSAPASSSKTWIAYTVTISPSATNLVGEPHDFTIAATFTDGTTTSPAANASIAFTWTGTGSPTSSSPCTTVVDGTCIVTVSSLTPGTGTLTVTTLTDSSGRVVDLTTQGTPGQATDQVVPLTATKTWTGWTLEVKKASSISDSTQSFSFDTTGFSAPDDQPFQLAIGETKTFAGLAVGTYTVTEAVDGLPTPWRFESLDCAGAQSNASVTTDGATATITVARAGSRGDSSGVIMCTYTNEQMNLVVHKTDGGASVIAGGAPFNYTITVTNEGSVATSDPITVTDTIDAGLEFAGAPAVPAGGTCAPPSGRTLMCTLTQSIAPGETVTIVVPARVPLGTVTSVQNGVTVDSLEDPLCPNGVCPPPPDCVSTNPALVAVVAEVAPTAIGGGDPSDNQACVITPVAGTLGEGDVPLVTTAPEPPTSVGGLARTGLSSLPGRLAVVCLLSGFGLVLVSRRRRTTAK